MKKSKFSMKDIFPNEIVIELTRKCNLDCDFCFNNQEGASSGEISKEEIFNLLEDAASFGIEAVRFSGGEPLLRKDISELIEKAKSLGLYMILNTNAMLIDGSNKNLFKNVDLAIFSFHYLDMLPTLKDKVRLLKDQNVNIMLATIATKKNIAQIGNFYQGVSELCKGIIAEWFILRQVPNINNKEPVSRKDINLLYEKIIECNNRYDMGIKVANSIPFCAAGGKAVDICKGGHFDSGHTRIVVSCAGFYKPDYFSKNIARIKDMSLKEVWNSDEFKSIREYKKVPKECNHCFYLKQCKGGLTGVEYLQEFNTVKNLASVIIPIFYSTTNLPLIIKSLNHQTCNNFEIILVNCSGRKILLPKIDKLNINIIESEKLDKFSGGLARNIGAKEAMGDILIFLDGNTLPYPKFIENHLRKQESHNIVLGYIAGFGNSKEKYDLESVSSLVNSGKFMKKIISDSRNEVFGGKVDGLEKWRYVTSTNISIKKDIFVENKFDKHLLDSFGRDPERGFRFMNSGLDMHFSKSPLCYSLNKEDMYSKQSVKDFLLMVLYSNEKHEAICLKSLLLDTFNSYKAVLRKEISLDDSKMDFILKGYPEYTFVVTKGIINRLNERVKDKRGTFCYRLWTHASIDEKGDVYSCWLRRPEKLGNIKENNLLDILNTKKMKALRKLSLEGKLPCYHSCVFDHINPEISLFRKLEIEKKDLEKLRVLFSYACNLRCIMCKQDHLAKDCIDFSALKKNVDISPFKTIELLGGEPLFIDSAKGFFEFVASNEKKVSFLTNATMIDDSWAEMIAKHSSFVHISLNAAKKETHELINQGSKWDTVLSNIKKIAKFKKKLSSDLKIRGHMTIVIENLDEISRFIDNFKELGFEEIEFGYDNRVPVYLALHPEKKAALKTNIQKALAKSPYKLDINTTDIDILYLT